MKVTVLGCGTSSGVPMIGCNCPVCRSPDPRNKRRRCSILIEALGRIILVDSGPDMRMQLLDAEVQYIDAMIYTHAHADHVHGIDDFRALNNVMHRSIPAYGDAAILEHIRSRFAYAFQQSRTEHGYWRPQLDPIPFDGPFAIGPVWVVPFRQRHGRSDSWGLRVGDFAYSTDCDHLYDETLAALEGVDAWIVDALRDSPHPSHAHLERTLGWIGQVGPNRAWLTHMNHEVDYAAWLAKLPAGIEPAYDGLVIELPDPTPVP